MVKNLASNRGDAGLILGLGSDTPHDVEQLGPCATTRKPECPEEKWVQPAKLAVPWSLFRKSHASPSFKRCYMRRRASLKTYRVGSEFLPLSVCKHHGTHHVWQELWVYLPHEKEFSSSEDKIMLCSSLCPHCLPEYLVSNDWFSLFEGWITEITVLFTMYNVLGIMLNAIYSVVHSFHGK